jgi:hypothetical protein
MLFVSSSSFAQYYYKDILSLQQTHAEHALIKSLGYRNIKIESFEEDGSQAEGFRCEKKISKDFLKTTLQTKMPEIGYSILTSQFDSKLQLTHVTDSSEMSVSYIDYEYDSTGRLHSCKSYSKSGDDDFMNTHSEKHVFSYNSQNQPERMLLIKNNKDTAFILFSYDEAGNVAIEKDARTGGKFYYYYDTTRHLNGPKLLTDIVHTSEFTNQLLTDYYMEYDDSGSLIQSTCFENGGKIKTTTRFTYENGLKKSEQIFINGKYTGKIEYAYSK